MRLLEDLHYSPRVIYTYATSEFPYYWRVFETPDEYFDGRDLPDVVLKKLPRRMRRS